VAAASLALVTLLVLTATGAPAQAATSGLKNLPRVALEIVLPPDLADLDDDLEQQVERVLREQPPAPILDPGSAPKLRLVVTVRPVGATELRGFWLPFSGTYAVGTVRLEVVRVVTLPGPAPSSNVPAIVWHAERHIAQPWKQVETAVGGAVEELLAAFLEDYRRARVR
jgi:hypothetical protein